jgi:hypothetical protein
MFDIFCTGHLHFVRKEIYNESNMYYMCASGMGEANIPFARQRRNFQTCNRPQNCAGKEALPQKKEKHKRKPKHNMICLS